MDATDVGSWIGEALAEDFVEGNGCGDGDVQGVGLAGHGQADVGIAQGVQRWRESLSFFAKRNGDGDVAREMGPEVRSAGERPTR